MVIVDIVDLPPPSRIYSEDVQHMLALTPGKAYVLDAGSKEEQQIIQNRFANKLKFVRERSPYYFRTMKTRTPDGVLQVAVLCEAGPPWYRRKEIQEASE